MIGQYLPLLVGPWPKLKSQRFLFSPQIPRNIIGYTVESASLLLCTTFAATSHQSAMEAALVAWM